MDSLTTVAPGVTLVPTVSDVAGTRELRELSLSIQTTDGQVIVVGCSHAGIERVVAAAVPVDSAVRLIVGVAALASAPDSVVERTALALRDRWHVQGVAPGHCTGEPGFAISRRTFGPGFVYSGLGTRIPIAGVAESGTPARPRLAHGRRRAGVAEAREPSRAPRSCGCSAGSASFHSREESLVGRDGRVALAELLAKAPAREQGCARRVPAPASAGVPCRRTGSSSS